MINKSILLYNRKINYTLRKSRRATRMRLAVYNDGRIIVTLPNRFPETKAEKYVIAKSKWITDKISFFKRLSLSKTFKLKKGDFEKNKQKSLKIIQKRIKHFNQKNIYKFNQLKIKNQKTRWGSCSRNKNLNFNYKVALLPDDLRDYVIVHELCHLKELNHSRKFWNLVQQTLPNYKELISSLKFNGLNLI